MGAALEHHTRALHIDEGLAGADPDNPGYQRDVAVSAAKVVAVLESVRDAAAIDYWSKTHQVLAALDAARKLADANRQLLD